MPVRAIAYEFPQDRNSETKTQAAAEGINKILDTGTYIGHIAVPLSIGSILDGRTIGEVVAGVVIIIDQPDSLDGQQS